MATERSRPSRPTKAVPQSRSAAELITNLSQLKPIGKRPVGVESILALLRATDIAVIAETDARAILQSLDRVDLRWTVRLHLLEDVDSPIPSTVARALRNLIITGAQSGLDFPIERPPSDGDVRGWIHRNTGPERNTDIPVAKVVAALWEFLEDRHFMEWVAAALRRETSYRRLGPGDPPTEVRRKRRKIAALAAPGFPFGDPARGALALGADAAAHTAAAEIQATAAQRERDEALERKNWYAHQLSESQRRLDEASMLLREAVAERDALKVELADSHQHAITKVAQVDTNRLGEVGRVRTRVAMVVREEVEELRLYLQRPQPNVQDALERLRHLDSLAREMEG